MAKNTKLPVGCPLCKMRSKLYDGSRGLQAHLITAHNLSIYRAATLSGVKLKGE